MSSNEVHPSPTIVSDPGITVEVFRDAMAHLGAAVHIITTDGPAGRAGFTATAVCSVTDTPPSVLVCVNRQSSAHATTVANGIVCINTLSADQGELSSNFSRKARDERFNYGEWLVEEGAAPALVGSVMSLHGRIIQITTVGTHDIMICEVTGICMNPHPGSLIYYNRQYHGIERVLRESAD